MDSKDSAKYNKVDRPRQIAHSWLRLTTLQNRSNFILPDSSDKILNFLGFNEKKVKRGEIQYDLSNLPQKIE